MAQHQISKKKNLNCKENRKTWIMIGNCLQMKVKDN